ncbi:hypothetical protein G7046_g1517 [Stylonectria norvegica]|nr:hypothetical protein G7046_g1517 [Stylonectria norvegica]
MIHSCQHPEHVYGLRVISGSWAHSGRQKPKHKLRHGKRSGNLLIGRLLQHGVTRTTTARTEEQRQRDVRKIKKYRDLEDQIRAYAIAESYHPELFQLTTELLPLNPEYYMIWNVRRRCLISSLLTKRPVRQRSNGEGDALQHDGHDSDIKVLNSELAFTIPLLTKFPKCYWIWNFRQWILLQAISRLIVPAARDIWETELGLTSMMLDRDGRNFHAWDYRRIVVAKLESLELRGKSMAEEEFAYTTTMIQRNLSNFSAWHNRSQIIPRLLQERDASPKIRADFLAEELSFVGGGLNLSPEDQSLWYYHQFLMSQIFDDGDEQTIVPAMDLHEKAAYVRRELDQIEDLLDDYSSVKWIYEALLEYTLALERLEQRARHDGVLSDLQTWLTQLRALDPMRTGRWNDVERQIGPWKV